MEGDTYEGENYGERTSKYNAAIAQLYRIDTLWKEAHKYSREGNYKSWTWTLDRVWMELIADTSDKDVIEVEKLRKIIRRIQTHPKITKKKMEDLLYYWLMKYETMLRKMQNKQGKGTAYRDISDEEMD